MAQRWLWQTQWTHGYGAIRDGGDLFWLGVVSALGRVWPISVTYSLSTFSRLGVTSPKDIGKIAFRFYRPTFIHTGMGSWRTGSVEYDRAPKC